VSRKRDHSRSDASTSNTEQIAWKHQQGSTTQCSSQRYTCHVFHSCARGAGAQVAQRTYSVKLSRDRPSIPGIPRLPHTWPAFIPDSRVMAADGVAKEYYESSKLAKYPFEPYWPDKKLRICVTGAGGFIASHLAKRLKTEGHHIIGCDWKRNEHMPVRLLACVACENARSAGSAYQYSAITPSVGPVVSRDKKHCDFP
jgi:NAD dependent epimerase/dehydratase family